MTRPPSGLDRPGQERAPRFRDGLGTRVRAADAGGDVVEHLHLVPELAAQESAIRDRVGRLINFRHARYVRLRGVDRLRGGTRDLVVSYDALDGDRLSTMLETLTKVPLSFEVDIAIQIVRDLLPAIGILHDSRKVTHGAIAPERLVFTQQQRLVIVDHGFGTALGRLNLPRKKLWDQFRIAVPSSNRSVFDERTDVVQIGLVALALLLGRPLQDDEYPAQLKRLIFTVKEASSRVGPRPIGPDLRHWLERALGIDEEGSYGTVKEAQESFEAVVATGRYAPSAAIVKSFFLRYQELVARLPAPAPAEADEPAPTVVVGRSPRPAKSADQARKPAPSIDALQALEEELSRLTADVTRRPATKGVDAGAVAAASEGDGASAPAVPVDVSAFERTAHAIYADAEARLTAKQVPSAAEAGDAAARDLAVRAELDARAQGEREGRAQGEREGRAQGEREGREKAEREAQVRSERESRERTARDAREQAEREAREQAEREARDLSAREQAEHDRAARDQAAREASARERAEREAREAAERQAKEAQQRAARESVERQAAEQAAREAAAREAAERVARERAERELRETAERAARDQAAREHAERQAAQLAARLEADRLAAEQAAREEAARDAAAREAAAQQARERAEQDRREAAERAAREQAAREQAAREAAEQAARLQAERDAAARAAEERAARLRAERDAAERTAREQAIREARARDAQQAAERAAAEQAAREAAAREAAEREARERAEQQARDAGALAAQQAAEREAAERAAQRAAERARREAAERELAERAAMEAAARASRAAAERAAVERAARELAAQAEADRLARAEAERAAREAGARATRDAAERASAEQAARLAAAQADAERQGREAAERAAREAADRAAREGAERQAAEQAAREASAQMEQERQARAAAEARAQQATEQAAYEQAQRVALEAQQAEAFARDTLAPASPLEEPSRRRRSRRRNPLAETTSLTPNPAILPEPVATDAPAPAADVPEVEVVEWTPALVVDVVPAWARGGDGAPATPEVPPAETVSFVAPPMAESGAGLERYSVVPLAAPRGSTILHPTFNADRNAQLPGMDADAAVDRSAAAVLVHRPRRRFQVNWARTLAASLLVALLEGVAFAAAWWLVTPKELGWLIVHTRPTGIQASIDGKVHGPTPFAIALPPGRHTIELQHGAASRVVPVEISPGVQTEQRIAWGKGFRTGQAKIASTPDGARVFVDGRPRGRTPLTIGELAAGRHEVTVEAESGSVTATLVVEAGETTELDVPVYSGWASILSPVELDILLAGRLIGTTEVEKLMLAPGRHRLELRNESLGYREMQEVLVRPGATTSVSVMPRTPVTVEAPEGTELLVDGEFVGVMPLESVRVALGTREFVFRRTGEPDRRQVTVVTLTAPVVVRY